MKPHKNIKIQGCPEGHGLLPDSVRLRTGFRWGLGRIGIGGTMAFGCLTGNAAPLPNDVRLTVTADGQTQTLHLHKRTARTPDFTLRTWDSTNGYQVVSPVPEVRTFRGTIAENPNAIVIASIDANNVLRAYCFDMEFSQNSRWVISTNVGSQLASPITPSAMPSQAVAAPRSGSTGTPIIGPKVPTGTSLPVGTPSLAVNYGDIVEYELAADLLVAAYNRNGQNIDSTLADYELSALIYEQMMLRSDLIRVVLPTTVIRKENFYTTDPGDVGLGALQTEWLKEPLFSTRWDNVWGSEGWYAWGGVGKNEGSFSAGALYHENTHNWGASHLVYQCDTMGGNQPSIGPITVEKILAKRKTSIDQGKLPTAAAYPEPVHPFTHVDVARVTVNTPQDLDVLANDWDSNGDTLTVSSFTTTTKRGGTVTLNANGTLRYVPPTNYVGKDVIVYTAQDNSTMGLKTREIVHIEVVNHDLMARYSFDETSGTSAADATGQGPVADLNGANFSTDSVASPLGQGVRASGTQNDDAIENGNWSGIILGATRSMPDSQPLLPRGSNWVTPFEQEFNKVGGFYDVLNGNYSFSTWFRADDFTNGAYIASKWWHPETSVGWDMCVAGSKLTLHWRIFDGAQGIQTLSAPTYAFVPGKWYHVASVFDRATGEARIYLNGTRVATRANAFPSNGMIFNGRAPLTLGCFANRQYCFDDTRLYSKALADSDVQTLYAAPGIGAPRFLSSSMAITTHDGIGVSNALWPMIWDGGSAITFSKVSGPAWLGVNADGTLTGTPSSSEIGTSTAVIRITNGSGSSDLTVNLTVLASQLRARWHFDEGSGTTAADASGNGKNATLSGATWGAAGREGLSCLITDGTATQYAQAPAINTTGGFTLAAWIKPGDLNGNQTLITQKSSYAFRLSGSGLLLTTPGIADHYSAGGILTANQWQHVAVSFQPGTAGGVKFYVNGVLKSSSNASSLSQNSELTTLAKSFNWSGDEYNGALDDVRVYGAILSAEEIFSVNEEYPTYTAPNFTSDPMTRANAIVDSAYSATLAGSVADPDAGSTLSYAKASGPAWLSIATDGSLSGSPTSADVGANSFQVRVTDNTGQTDVATLNILVKRYLAGHWSFDEGNGTTAADSSGANNTATMNGANWSLGRIGASGMTTNGTTTQYAQAAPVNTSGGFTVAAWIKPAALSGARVFVSQNGSYAFKTNGTGLTLTTPSIADHNTPSGLLVANQWQHVVISFTPGTTGGAKFYVNGVLRSTLNASGLNQNSNPLLFGKTTNWTGQDYSGGLDEICIYGVPLNGTEVADLYASYPGYTAPAFTTDPVTKSAATEDSAYSASLATDITDPDAGDAKTFSKVSGPAWLSVASNGALSGTPNNSNVGANSFVVRVTDSTGLTDDAALNITVNNTNDAPAFTVDPIAGSDATEGNAYSGNISGTAADVDIGDVLTYSKVSGPAWLTVASNGALSGMPGVGAAGSNSFTVRVTDAAGASDDAVLTIQVTKPAGTGDADGDGFTNAFEEAAGSDPYSNASTPSGVYSGLQAWWRLDEASGTSADDATGRPQDGVLIGSPAWTSGLTGNAITFNGSNQSVQVPSVSLSSNTVTLTAWVKRNGTQSVWSGMVFDRGNGASGLGFGTNHELRYTWNNTSNTYNFNSGLTVPDNTWTFCAVVVEATKATLYMQPAGGTMQSAVNTVTHATHTFSSSTYLGQDSQGSRFFKGALDDVKIHSRALSATEIGQLASQYALPLPWSNANVGTGALAGGSLFSNGKYTISGSGVLGGTADQANYAYQTLSGDGEIVAKIATLHNTGTSAAVGVVVRDSLAAGAPHVFVGSDGAGTYKWSRRTTTGGTATVTNGSAGTPGSQWVKIVRSGDTFTVSTSADGNSWSVLGSATVTMASNCYIGLSNSSGSTTTINTSQFTQVGVNP